MRRITVEMVRKLKPCYDPTKYFDESWTGTIIDVLNLGAAPEQDRLWLVLREDFLSDKLLRLFAVNCARKVQHLCHDKRSHDAIDAAEKFANGQITSQELAAAGAEAWSAAWSAAAAAWSAPAGAAAWSAAAAAWSAPAGAAAWSAAAAAAAWSAPAAAAAGEAGAAAAAQIQELKKMISEMPEEVK